MSLTKFDPSDIECLSAFVRAMELKPSSVQSFDADAKTLDFKSTRSGDIYHVTYDSCDCADFHMKGDIRPCKHQIFLGIACDYDFGIPRCDAAKHAATLSSLKAELKSAWKNGELSTSAYVKLITDISKLK